jgi:hypothetical protein
MPAYIGNFFPFLPTLGTPPSGYQVGLTLAEACHEFWRSKVTSCSWDWNYLPNSDPSEGEITWSGGGSVPSLTSWYVPAPTPAIERRVVDYLQTSFAQAGITGGAEFDEVAIIFAVDWSSCYRHENLIYPAFSIALGGVEGNQVTNTGSNPWGGTCTVFGKPVILYDDTLGSGGGPKTGNVTVESTSYWPAA